MRLSGWGWRWGCGVAGQRGLITLQCCQVIGVDLRPVHNIEPAWSQQCSVEAQPPLHVCVAALYVYCILQHPSSEKVCLTKFDHLQKRSHQASMYSGRRFWCFR